MNVTTAAGQEHRCLAGRIAAADHDDVLVLAHLAFKMRCRVVHAHAGVLLQIWQIRLAILRAGCDQHSASARDATVRHLDAIRPGITVQCHGVACDIETRAELL
jgi:hypothetical protein